MKVGSDKNKNIERAREKMAEAARMKPDVMVLPEMFCCPYSGKYFKDFGEGESGPAQAALSASAREHGVLVIGGSIPELCGDRLYNTSYVYGETGELIAKHRKAHMFDADVAGGIRFCESDFFSSGDSATTFATRFGTFGLCVCFDFRFQEMARIMALRGASVIFVPAAFNMTTGPAHWETMFRQRAVDNQVFAVGAAPARDTDADYVSYGNSIAVNPWGEVIARCGGDEATLFAELDLKLTDEIRRQLPILDARRTDMYEVTESRGTDMHEVVKSRGMNKHEVTETRGSGR